MKISGLPARLVLQLALLAAAGITAPIARADSDGGAATPTMGMTSSVGSNTTGIGSIATCEVIVRSGFRNETVVAAGEIANTTAAFVCNQTDLGNMTVRQAAAEAAETISVVAARLVAQLTVDCFARGTTDIIVSGMGLVEREAAQLAEAFAANISEVKVCSDCNETASFVAGNFSDIIMNATAIANVSLQLATDEETQEIAVSEFVESVTEVFVVDFTRVLIRSRSGAVDEGCPAPPAGPPSEPQAPENAMQIECDESEPVANLEKCSGSGIDVPKSCATPGFFCVTRGPRFGACRKDGIPVNDEWAGIVFECI
eukprot:jgi/Ulvmu1/10678/UM067_0002.1